MSSKIDVINAWHEESYTNPPESVVEANQKYLSDDFQNLDEDGNVQWDKQAQIGLSSMIFSAFKDYRGIVEDLRDEGDDVIMTFHFEGTHTGDLDLTAMGLGVIPPSGKKIVWPQAKNRVSVEDGQITKIQAYEGTGSMKDFLEPLGVELPSA